HLGPSLPLLPTRNVTIPQTDQLAWKDLTPKIGAAYDLFGDSRTALKVTLNKYLSGRQVDALGNPVAGLVLQTTRNWTDTNTNCIPDCDLSNPADNGECRAMANPNFGKAVGATVYDPETLRGWTSASSTGSSRRASSTSLHRVSRWTSDISAAGTAISVSA